MTVAVTLGKLALALAEREGASGAAEAIRALLGVLDRPEAPPSADARPALATFAAFGALCGVSHRTVQSWLASGRLPRSVVVGRGSGSRIVVAEALDLLRAERCDATGPEVEGRALVAGRRVRSAGVVA